MITIPLDTTIEAAAVQYAVFRRMSPGRRFQLALNMSDSVRNFTLTGIRSRHPEYNEAQVRHSFHGLIHRIAVAYDTSPTRQRGTDIFTTQEHFLIEIAALLDASGIPFMIAGSIGSSVHGLPRATNDADIVVHPTSTQLEDFLTRLGNRYYVSKEAARDALRSRFMFNIIDTANGWKADLIIRKDRPFSVAEFDRRRLQELSTRQLPVASPEDVILTKLEWDKLTPSERQVTDAFGVITVQRERLDRTYLLHWAASLGVSEKLEELLTRADALGDGTCL